MKYIEKKCEGHCPKCNGENINWHDSEIKDEMVIYEAHCDNCNIDFTEEHKLVYNITVIQEV